MTFGQSLGETARKINRHSTTVSREIKKRRIFISSKFAQCSNYIACRAIKICGNKRCMGSCKTCKTVNCREICGNFAPLNCRKLDRFPFVCNNCPNRELCRFEQAYYHANKADADYHSELSDSRKAIHADEEQITRINELITPLIKNGQSLAHIYTTHADTLNCSRKTMYNYIDRGIFTVRNIDLPLKVRYKRRKQKATEPFDYAYREGRTYEDFKAFIAENPDVGIVEMDTVKGKREKGKVMLTMVFTKYDLMLIFLLDANTQECVIDIFRYLEKALGIGVFRRIFPVILTDNGSEFKNPIALEKGRYGLPLTKIFYCDPNASYIRERC